MSFIIGADIVPTSGNKKYFSSGEMVHVVGGDLLDLLKQADYRIFNLETPLVDITLPISKCGPLLSAETSTVSGLKSLKIDLLTLANNHIMDQSGDGLLSTLRVLKDNGIKYCGAAESLKKATQPFVVNVKGKRIGFYACTEHEFSIASYNMPGANPFDPLESFDHISSLKEECDYVVVLYHGGKEHYRYPSPMLQRVCRKFVDRGADLVLCQHSHCIGCEEKYLNATIVYGQGNFIFSSCEAPTELTSILIKVNDEMSIEYIPLLKTKNGVCLAKANEAKQIMDDFFSRSKHIQHEGFVDEEYNRFAKKSLNNYLLTCSGYGHHFLKRCLNKICGHKLSNHFGKNSYNKNELLAILNFIECEAHRELWINGLRSKVKGV